MRQDQDMSTSPRFSQITSATRIKCMRYKRVSMHSRSGTRSTTHNSALTVRADYGVVVKTWSFMQGTTRNITEFFGKPRKDGSGLSARHLGGWQILISECETASFSFHCFHQRWSLVTSTERIWAVHITEI